MSMPEDLLRRIVRKCLSISKLSNVGLLLMLRRVCKCSSQVVHETLFQILTQGTPMPRQRFYYSASFAADTKQALSMSASWIVLVALSAACRTEANLLSVRMAIYTTAFQSRPDLHIPDQIREKVKDELQSIIEPWCVVVADRVSCVLERSHVRPTREQTLSNLRAAFRCV
jgi:hypothetical protein